MKRVISLILCILMMVSIVPGFVFAEDANHAGFWSQWLEGITIHNLMNKAGLTACHPAEAMDLNALTRSFFRLTNACEHSYGEPEFDWESDEDLVYATFECELCGAQEIIASEYEVKQVPATDTEPAKIVKYVTVEFNGESYYNEYVIIVPDEHDHDYDGPEWSFDTSENLVGIFTCKVCEDQQVVVCTNAKVKSTQAASCTTPKTIVYTGSIQFEGKTYTHEWNKEYGKALGHQFGAWTVSTRPSCTEAGIESRTCSRCQEVETREYGSALGHEFSEWTVNQ